MKLELLIPHQQPGGTSLTIYPLIQQWPDVGHYAIFGGDSIVELLAAGTSNAVRINEPTLVETKPEI
jgi:hypothetical protein